MRLLVLGLYYSDKVVGWAAISECKLRCIAVHPEYRGQGVGRTLTEKRLKYLGDCDSVISYAWIRPDGTYVMDSSWKKNLTITTMRLE